MLNPGVLLGERYRLIRRIGEGGMGTVFEAEHTLVGRRVAIKVMLPECARHPDVVERFEREARAAGAIGHQGIVGVVDFGRHEGQPYMVMEYLDGEDLADRLDRHGALPVREAVWVLGEVLSALSAAHAVGIVHRDLKPENVFIVRRPDGSALVKVLDFGVSKFGAEEGQGSRSLTKTGVLMGTPTYMAPEQALARRDVDFRADIYAAGVLLYETLTNKLPYEAQSQAELLMAIVYQKPPPTPVREHRPDIPEGLAAVIERAMSSERELRYQDSGQFIEALRPFGATAESDPRVPFLFTELPPLAGDGAGTPKPVPASAALAPGVLRWAGVALVSVAALTATGFVLRSRASSAQRVSAHDANVRVDLQNVPVGATVRVDGIVTALRAFTFVRHSAHELEVSAPGSAAFQTSFTAERDRSVVIALAALDPPALLDASAAPSTEPGTYVPSAPLPLASGPHDRPGGHSRGHRHRRRQTPLVTPDPLSTHVVQPPHNGSAPNGVLTPTNVF